MLGGVLVVEMNRPEPKLSFHAAAFLLLRLERMRKVFKRRRSKQRKPNCQVTESGLPATSRPQLVRSRTLPAIVVPGAGDGDPDSQDDGVDKKDGRHAISNTASPIGGVRNFSLRNPPSPALLRVPNTDSRISALSRLLSPDRPSWTSLNDSSADCSPTPLRRSTSIDSLNRPSPPRSQPEDSSDSPPKPASQSQSRKGSAESPGIRRRLYKDKLDGLPPNGRRTSEPRTPELAYMDVDVDVECGTPDVWWGMWMSDVHTHSGFHRGDSRGFHRKTEAGI
ncbi:uncharacterized protein LOC122374046, partial [Amphibalanus amphitrite]|uniref:uncharacterized protein LOC122374046 n=1 Tax=Amphibalanus amphitrite TaxID=1232801 RepID=UPI001C90B36F